MLYNFINLLFEKLLVKGFDSNNNLKFLDRVTKDFSFSVEDLFIFKNLEFFFDIFTELPHLNVTCVLNKKLTLFDQTCFLRLCGLKLV